MRISFDRLPGHVQDQFQRIWDQQGAGEGAFFERKSNRWMGWVGLLCLLACPLAAAMGLEAWRDSPPGFKPVVLVPALIALVTGIYAPVVTLEWLRLLRARPGRFRLITPAHYVECGGPGRTAILYRLSEVTRFQKTQSYDSNQRWEGLTYAFTFEDGPTLTVKLKEARDIEALDAILAWAAAKGRGEALPDLPGLRALAFDPAALPAARPTLAERLLDPQSEVWLGAWGLLVLALLGVWVLVVVTAPG